MTHPFSESFIMMAAKADPVQALRPVIWETGNFYWCPRRAEVWAVPDWPPGGKDEHDVDKWLPHLHQLMAIMGDRPMDFMLAAEDHQRNWFDIYGPHKENWHELVLVMIMRVRFAKQWDGRGWIAIDRPSWRSA